MSDQQEAGTFVQWKGSDICMDWWCECGEQYHVDGDFLYAVQCGACGKTYSLDPHVRLISPPEDWAGDASV
jgi:hypothetical protein